MLCSVDSSHLGYNVLLISSIVHSASSSLSSSTVHQRKELSIQSQKSDLFSDSTRHAPTQFDGAFRVQLWKRRDPFMERKESRRQVPPVAHPELLQNDRTRRPRPFWRHYKQRQVTVPCHRPPLPNGWRCPELFLAGVDQTDN